MKMRNLVETYLICYCNHRHLKEYHHSYLIINNLLIKDPDDYKAVIVRANNPIPSECGIFYFEIKIINKGKNG